LIFIKYSNEIKRKNNIVGNVKRNEVDKTGNEFNSIYGEKTDNSVYAIDMIKNNKVKINISLFLKKILVCILILSN